MKPFTDEEFLAAVPNRHIKAELGYSVRPFRAFDRVVLASALVFSIMRVAAADEAAKAPEEMIWISGGEFEMGVVVWCGSRTC